jgi:hypothetical protein
MNKYHEVCKLMLLIWQFVLMHHLAYGQLYDGRSSSEKDIQIITVKVSERMVSIQIDNAQEFIFSELKEDVITL